MTRLDIRNEVRQNLFDAGITHYTDQVINDTIQDCYNYIVIKHKCVTTTAIFPIPSTSYVNLFQIFPSYLSVKGFWNFTTNLWLQHQSYKELDEQRRDWERWTGTPYFYSLLDWRRVALVPYLTNPSGNLLIWFAKRPDPLLDPSVPQFSVQYHGMLVDFSTAVLFEMSKEISKAKLWFGHFKSNYDNFKLGLKNLAAADKLKVLEPWFPLGRFVGTTGDDVNIFIDNEIPTGVKDGVNAVFTLAYTPTPQSSLTLYRNGICLAQGIGYSLNGNVITMSAGYLPSDARGDVLRAFYRTQ